MSGEKEDFEINAALALKDQNSNSNGIGADMEKQNPADADGDEALKIVGNGQVVEIDAAVNRRLLWKIGMYRFISRQAIVSNMI